MIVSHQSLTSSSLYCTGSPSCGHPRIRCTSIQKLWSRLKQVRYGLPSLSMDGYVPDLAVAPRQRLEDGVQIVCFSNSSDIPDAQRHLTCAVLANLHWPRNPDQVRETSSVLSGHDAYQIRAPIESSSNSTNSQKWEL